MMRRMKIKAAPNLIGVSKKKSCNFIKNEQTSMNSGPSIECNTTSVLKDDNNSPILISESDLLNSLNVEERENILNKDNSLSIASDNTNKEVIESISSPRLSFTSPHPSEKVEHYSSHISTNITPSHYVFNKLPVNPLKEGNTVSCSNLDANSMFSNAKLLKENERSKLLENESHLNESPHEEDGKILNSSKATLSQDAVKNRFTSKPYSRNIGNERRSRIKGQPIISKRRKLCSSMKTKPPTSQSSDILVDTSNTDASIVQNDASSKNLNITKGNSQFSEKISVQKCIENTKHDSKENIDNSCKNLKPASSLKTIKKETTLSERNVFYARKLCFKKKMNEGYIEKDRLTMFDLIFWNPSSNPLPEKKVGSRTKSNVLANDDVNSSYEQEVEEKGLLVESTEQNQNREDLDHAATEDESPCLAPQVRIGPDGELVVDEKSIMIETTAVKNRNNVMKNSEVVEESIEGSRDGYKRLNKRRKRSREWTRKETARFYKALASVGTDFSLMTSVFHWRSRAELKIKFKKEDRINRHLIDCALNDCTQFDFSIFDESDYDPDEDRKCVKEEGKIRYRWNARKTRKEDSSYHKTNEKKAKALQLQEDKKRAKELRRLKKNFRKRKEYNLRKERQRIRIDVTDDDDSLPSILCQADERAQEEDRSEVIEFSLRNRKINLDFLKAKSVRRFNNVIEDSSSDGVDADDLINSVGSAKSNSPKKESAQMLDSISQKLNPSGEVDDDCNGQIRPTKFTKKVLYSSEDSPDESSCTANQTDLINKGKASNVRTRRRKLTVKPSKNLRKRVTRSNKKQPKKDNITLKADEIICEMIISSKCPNKTAASNSVGLSTCTEESDPIPKIRKPNKIYSRNSSINSFKIGELKNNHDANQLQSLMRSGKISPFRSEGSHIPTSTLPPHRNSPVSSLGSCEVNSTNGSRFSVTDSDLDGSLFTQSGSLDDLSPLSSIPISIDTDLYTKLCDELNVEIVSKPPQMTQHSQFQLTSSSSHLDSTSSSDEGFSTFCIPVKEIMKDEFGDNYVLINSNSRTKKIPVPNIEPFADSIVVMETPNPKDQGENIYHVYTVAPVRGNDNSGNFDEQCKDVKKKRS